MLEYLQEKKEFTLRQKRFSSDGYRNITSELAEKIIGCTEDEIDALASEMLLNTNAFISFRKECDRNIEYYEKEISKNETV